MNREGNTQFRVLYIIMLGTIIIPILKTYNITKINNEACQFLKRQFFIIIIMFKQTDFKSFF